MKVFEFTAKLRGLHLVKIESISFKDNSRGEYIDIEVSKDGKKYHIFNNVNKDTENYVIAQLCNAGNQLQLEDCTSPQLIKKLKGQELEITVSDNGFAIAPYKVLVEQEEIDSL